jgi:hypothetical protein
MPVVNREALAGALKQKRSVSVGSRTITELRDLPPDPPEGSSDPKVQGAILRNENGSLTRDGMEHAIKTGGGFLHGGEVITRMEDAPTPEEMAAGDAIQVANLQADIDRRKAEIAAQETRLKEMHANAQEAKANAERDAKEQAKAQKVETQADKAKAK